MISTLREYWHTRPFIPFTIHLADGRALAVPHPDFFLMSGKGGQIFVNGPEDEVYVVNPLIIVSISRASETAVA